MENFIKSVSYDTYHRYLMGYQIIATCLVCLPVFLSIFILIGLPHFIFLMLIIHMRSGRASVLRRIVHLVMMLYYTVLLVITLQLWPDIMGNWLHADSIDFLIRAQMMLLPVVLTVQIPLIAFEWMYPILLPHEHLEQQPSSRRGIN